MKQPKLQVVPHNKKDKKIAKLMEKFIEYEFKKYKIDLEKINRQPAPFAFYPNPEADHMWCRWYCKFLFWKKHPKFIQRREFMSFKSLK